MGDSGDFRVGNHHHSIEPSSEGVTKKEGTPQNATNIFSDKNTDQTTQQCREKGVVSKKTWGERKLEILTDSPPLGKTILNPFFY